MSSTNILAPDLPTQAGDIHKWGNLHGSSVSLAITSVIHKHTGPVLVVVDSNESAERLRRELGFFWTQAEDEEIFTLPDWETLPYDNFSAHQDIISDRLNTLYHLPQLDKGVLIVSIGSLMHKLAPKDYVISNSLVLDIHTQFDTKAMGSKLAFAGYNRVDSVYEHGEFAIRGSIMDIFPMGSKSPYRIDLLDDEIDSLRIFDPDTQRSLNQVSSIRLLPAGEYPLNKDGINTFRANFRETFDIDLRHCLLYQDISQGLSSPGVEYYLKLFHPHLHSLFDYLPRNTLVCRYGRLNASANQFWSDIKLRYEDRCVDPQRPILKPSSIFVNPDEIFVRFKDYPGIILEEPRDQSSAAVKFNIKANPDLPINSNLHNPLQALQDFVSDNPETEILFCAESAGRRETLLELLKTIDIYPCVIDGWADFPPADKKISITVAPLDQGLYLQNPHRILVAESQLFGQRIAQRRRRRKTQDNTDFIIKSLTELHLGAAVVHIDHGVGRYRGLQTLTIDGEETEFLTLEYAKQAKLYVPVSSLHLISRYNGAEPDLAPMNHLGNDQWQKTRRKAAEKIRDVATELLDIYARRKARKGFQYNSKNIDYERFSASFPFEETPDQEQTIAAVVKDMSSSHAMDRLVCGDVGFGKTEVAMRAAFIAVQNDKQVAILVPTTLLAQQHLESFSDRFADWPFVVDVISRFKTSKQLKLTLDGIRLGKVDIIIGTHKLLQDNLDYKNLGLLIVDEEHRFGVRQKEKIKALRSNIDILTLTATPIPRTLNMSMSGIRDLSLIVTPPAKRLSIKTFVREAQDSLIKEAVLRELLRGGQVFYVHNEVKSIDRAAEHLQEIVPEARICVAHGQMPERQLEQAMADFYHKRYNVLVCSTIIETGIDVPSANTIIINRADKFGLAQLHQLRGRVGRSHHQAYAYLITPHRKSMSSDALKRIEAITAASNLGAGFTLASHDLEIRGAGEFLGDEQSGHMQKIGFTLYTEMLDEAVKAIKEGRDPATDLILQNNTEINLRIPALIPEQYLPDIHARLIMYKRIAGANDDDELTELQVEMIDRFGNLPNQTKLLFGVTALKLRAQSLGIKKIDANTENGKMEFAQNTPVDPLSIVQLVQKQPQLCKLIGANRLQFIHNTEQADKRIQFIHNLLENFTTVNKSAA